MIHIRFENEDLSCWGDKEHDYTVKGEEFFRTEYTQNEMVHRALEHYPSWYVLRAWQKLRNEVHRRTYPGNQDWSKVTPEEVEARKEWYAGIIEKFGSPTRLVITLELRKSQATEPEQSAP